MAVALLAVQELATQTQREPSLDSRASRIAIRGSILPLVFGVLITVYVDLAFATSRTKRDRDLARRPAAADRNRRAAQRRRRHLSDHQRHAAAGAAAVGERSVRATLAGLAPQPDARGHHRARGRVAARKLRQQGLPPRPHARGRNAGAGWRGADAGLHGADRRRARVDAPSRARLDLAAPRQRQARGPQFGRAARTAPTTASPACSSR